MEQARVDNAQEGGQQQREQGTAILALAHPSRADRGLGLAEEVRPLPNGRPVFGGNPMRRISAFIELWRLLPQVQVITTGLNTYNNENNVLLKFELQEGCHFWQTLTAVGRCRAYRKSVKGGVKGERFPRAHAKEHEVEVDDQNGCVEDKHVCARRSGPAAGAPVVGPTPVTHTQRTHIT